MTCLHIYGEVKDRYQYCTKCGIAVVAPCNHLWIEKHVLDQQDNNLKYTGKVYVLECTKCGDYKEVRIMDL